MKEKYHHVFVRPKGAESFQLLAKDLTERQLKKSVIHPYKKGKDIYQMSNIVSTHDIGSLVIICTSRTAEQELKWIADEHLARIAEEESRSSAKIISLGRGRDILELMDTCEDVTKVWISQGPGSGTISTKVVSLLHNQWVTGIGLLIVGLLIGKYWGGGT